MACDIDAFAFYLNKLKELPRSGWLARKIPAPESVAEHSYGVVLLTLLLAPKHLNLEKCLKMAILHDLQEGVVGDYTPYDNISVQEKSLREKEAMRVIAEKLGNMELLDIFEEYEQNTSPEAKFVKDMDRIECILQAKYYDNKYHRNNELFEEFFQYGSARLNKSENIVSETISKIK